jgi:hypothetical protein
MPATSSNTEHDRVVSQRDLHDRAIMLLTVRGLAYPCNPHLEDIVNPWTDRVVGQRIGYNLHITGGEAMYRAAIEECKDV